MLMKQENTELESGLVRKGFCWNGNLRAGRRSLQGPGAGAGALTQALTCQIGSGGIKADLIASGVETVEAFGRDGQGAPGFQETSGNILERANPMWEGAAKQTALFKQLEKDAGDLQQEIEDFAGGIILAVRVFEVEAAVFLDIEAFVFDFPSQASTLIGKGINIVDPNAEVGEPLVLACAHIPLRIGLGLFTEQDIEEMETFLAIDIFNGIDPAIVLAGLELRTQEQPFFVLENVGQDNLIAAMNVFQVLILEHNQIFPVVVGTKLENRAASIQSIQQ